MNRVVLIVGFATSIGWSAAARSSGISKELHVVENMEFPVLRLDLGENDFLHPGVPRLVQLASLSVKTSYSSLRGAAWRSWGLRTALQPGAGLLADAGSPTEISEPPFKPPRSRLAWRKPLGWTAVGVGGAALIAGFICHMYVWDYREENKDVSSENREQINDKIDSLNIAFGTLYGVGAVVAISGVALLLWEEYVPLRTRVEASPQHAAITVGGVF